MLKLLYFVMRRAIVLPVLGMLLLVMLPAFAVIGLVDLLITSGISDNFGAFKRRLPDTLIVSTWNGILEEYRKHEVLRQTSKKET